MNIVISWSSVSHIPPLWWLNGLICNSIHANSPSKIFHHRLSLSLSLHPPLPPSPPLPPPLRRHSFALSRPHTSQRFLFSNPPPPPSIVTTKVDHCARTTDNTSSSLSFPIRNKKRRTKNIPATRQQSQPNNTPGSTKFVVSILSRTSFLRLSLSLSVGPWYQVIIWFLVQVRFSILLSLNNFACFVWESIFFVFASSILPLFAFQSCVHRRSPLTSFDGFFFSFVNIDKLFCLFIGYLSSTPFNVILGHSTINNGLSTFFPVQSVCAYMIFTICDSVFLYWNVQMNLIRFCTVFWLHNRLIDVSHLSFLCTNSPVSLSRLLSPLFFTLSRLLHLCFVYLLCVHVRAPAHKRLNRHHTHTHNSHTQHLLVIFRHFETFGILEFVILYLSTIFNLLDWIVYSLVID